MTEQHHIPPGDDTRSERRADTASGDWSSMESELAGWGRQLDEMRANADSFGRQVLDDLQRRYDALTAEAEQVKQRTERKIEETRREAETLRAEAARQSASTASAARERGEKVRQGARELGNGFARAWDELRSGARRAYDRLNQGTR